MMRGMRITFLGTATSHGIPMIGCDCAVCRSADARNQRLRPSIYVETPATKVLVDATPDLRTQVLRANIRQVDAVLITHAHADHILGLDDLRAFTERAGHRMPLYGSPDALQDIARIFPYACVEKPRWPGLPSFELRPVAPLAEFAVGDLPVRTLPVRHGYMTVYGFVFGRDLAYVTDCNTVSSEALQAITGVTVLVIDALRHRPHPTHLTITQAQEVAARVKPQLTLLTHLCHEVEHVATEKELPAGVRIAYDGMQIETENGTWLMAGS